MSNDQVREALEAADAAMNPPSISGKEWSDRMRAATAKVRAALAALSAPPTDERVRAALGDDNAGRPFPELLRVVADRLRDDGGGPLEDCLRAKADEVEAALAYLSAPPKPKETEG